MVENVSKWRKVVNMLIGQYQTKINEKGRIALPSKFKKDLGSKLIVTVGYEQSLMIVSYKDWQGVIDRVNQGVAMGATRETDRFLLGNAFEVELDSQGRFIVPRYLRAYAALTEEIVFVGVGNRAEIWSQPVWEKYNQSLIKKSQGLGA
jgi:MraZ protein